MQKDRPPDWRDTNLALFGSEVEYKIKEAAAQAEPQWTGAGTQKGTVVWRIEQFKVVPWPANKYGEFHVGDSYIVLHTYAPNPDNPNALAWDIHFWIGNVSTQDEYGTAAYKTVELDDHLKRKARQHREVQDH
jgi:gelsolin